MSIAVDKAYLMITTRCNVHCRYCIVRKTNRDMQHDIVERALNLVAGSRGDFKRIALYGGEPLVRFETVTHTVGALERLARQYDKRFECYLYTNGLLLDEPKLDYCAVHGLRLIFSYDVARHFLSQKHRADDETTAGLRRQHLAHALDVLGPHSVCGACVVLPEETEFLADMVGYMIECLGLRVIKILPGLVRYHWKKRQLVTLKRQLDMVWRRVTTYIGAGRPVYIDMLNEALWRRNVLKPAAELFLPVVEIYPDGDIGLSPCEFDPPAGEQNVNDITAYRLGNVADWQPARVVQAYRDMHKPSQHGLYLFSRWAERLAEQLIEHARDDEGWHAYVQAAAALPFA